MAYSRWGGSRWYTFWSARSGAETQYKWPTQKLKNSQVFEICDIPSYCITYDDLVNKSRSKVLHEVKKHFDDKVTWDELSELQEYFSEFIRDVDEHFQLWEFFKYEWYYPTRNEINWKIRKIKQQYEQNRSK